jgi:hypothetical protein
MSLSDKREQLYSREKLIPESVIGEMPYRLTYEALVNQDIETLMTLIINTQIRN